MEVKEKLTEVWKTFETKQLGKIFKEYMEELGIKKLKSNYKDKTNSYSVDGKCTGWNRVKCYYYKDGTKFAEADLELVLRKRPGSYFIVTRKCKRAFEVDYQGIVNYDEKLLNKIMQEHKPLFDKLFKNIKMD